MTVDRSRKDDAGDGRDGRRLCRTATRPAVATEVRRMPDLLAGCQIRAKMPPPTSGFKTTVPTSDVFLAPV